MEANDKTFVWFGAHDYKIEAAVVTQLMGLEPTKVRVAGETFKTPKMTSAKLIKRNLWKFDSQLTTSAHVEEHLEALLALLEARADALEKLATVYEAELEIGGAIYYEDWTPGIHLSRELTRRLAQLGLSLDLDLYFRGSSE